MKRTVKYQIIIIVLAITNLFLIYNLAFTPNNNQNHEPSDKPGFYVNGVVSGINSNANFSTQSGYTAELGDTVLIDHHLKVMNIINNDDIEPMNYLFEFNQTDSSFTLVSEMPYTGNNSFDYHVVNNNTKLLFIQVVYPLNGEYTSFLSFLELRVIDSLGTLSPTISDTQIDSLYRLFSRKSSSPDGTDPRLDTRYR